MAKSACSGFVDLQVNGFLGIDFSAEGLTVDAVRTVTRELVRRGTAAFCPTIITAPPAWLEENLPILARACREPDLEPHLLGIHLEGPFFAAASRGAHQAEWLREPDVALFDRWQTLAEGRIRILTLAPELPGADLLIEHASKAGVVVSLGHHLADDASITRAAQAGARASTHLGNGIPNMLPRHPNPIWAQLACDELLAMIIPDGHHIPESFIRTVLKTKGVSNTIVVSDVSPVAGQPPGDYVFAGNPVVIEPSGRIAVKDRDSLAGSSATMLDCMNIMAGLGCLSEADLWSLGRDNPLQLLGIPDRPLDVSRCRIHYENGHFVLGG
ncbi:MAG: amidohydrolase family protein [Verrucomicrobia bacterium]|nr:amidohydrolase family protein [Verrucomicrobiota bacterium]